MYVCNAYTYLVRYFNIIISIAIKSDGWLTGKKVSAAVEIVFLIFGDGIMFGSDKRTTPRILVIFYLLCFIKLLEYKIQNHIKCLQH